MLCFARDHFSGFLPVASGEEAGRPNIVVILCDESNYRKAPEATLTDFEIFDLSSDPGETKPLPLDGSPLPAQLRDAYREAVKDFHVWPAVGD